MGALFFSTGQAARELGISPSQIRALCAAGGIEAQTTPGGQYRIPKPELERLQRDGLPEVPRPLPDENPRRSPANSRYGHPALLAEPSDSVIDATEGVAITEARLRQRKLEWELLTTEDHFTERESAEAEREAEQAYQEHARQAGDQARRDHDEAVRFWEARALGLVPQDAPPELALHVQEAVRDRLLSLTPAPAPPVAQQIVEALVAGVLGPWIHTQQIMAVLIEVRDEMLPVAARRSTPPVTVWQSRAIRAAGEAITQLRDDAPVEQIRAVAREAVASVIQEFDHDQHSKRLVHDLWLQLPDATSAELGMARHEVGKALAGLPPSASGRDRAAARDAAIAPLRNLIAERQAVAESERRRIQAEERAERERSLAEAQAAQGRKWAAVLDAQQRAYHNSDKRDILIGLFTMPLDMLGALTPEATEAVTKALDALPVPAAWEELTQARDKALAPYLAAYPQRRRKETLIAGALQQVLPRLVELEASGRWDYEGQTAADLARQFTPAIRKRLELDLTGQEPPEAVARRVRQLVRKELENTPAVA